MVVDPLENAPAFQEELPPRLRRSPDSAESVSLRQRRLLSVAARRNYRRTGMRIRPCNSGGGVAAPCKPPPRFQRTASQGSTRSANRPTMVDNIPGPPFGTVTRFRIPERGAVRGRCILCTPQLPRALARQFGGQQSARQYLTPDRSSKLACEKPRFARTCERAANAVAFSSFDRGCQNGISP
jgi:hypothetical protein